MLCKFFKWNELVLFTHPVLVTSVCRRRWRKRRKTRKKVSPPLGAKRPFRGVGKEREKARAPHQNFFLGNTHAHDAHQWQLGKSEAASGDAIKFGAIFLKNPLFLIRALP